MKTILRNYEKVLWILKSIAIYMKNVQTMIFSNDFHLLFENRINLIIVKNLRNAHSESSLNHLPMVRKYSYDKERIRYYQIPALGSRQL